jgi:DNA-binding MarR family transcriptional regulator
VPSQSADDQPADPAPPPALADRLGYLLKHAQLRLAELSRMALAPFGISGRELAVLLAIDDRASQSQQEVARRMAVDRTTMVALIDDLEHKGLVRRQPDPDDRRKNVVVLTDAGRTTLRQATAATREAERRLLGSLSDDESAMLKKALQAIVFSR